MNKSELLDALSKYPDNAQVIFNIDKDYTFNKALTVEWISYLDGDYIYPDLCPGPQRPVIFVHLTEKNERLTE